MPGVGGLSIANNLLSNNVQYNLNQNQASLKKVTQQLSSGLRINGPADDPSGFSIATNLQTQVNSYDQASNNIQDATNATTVASGALSTVTSILQQVRTLAVEASSNLLSTTDRANIQTEVSQLVSEVNSIANNTSFNGINLLNGSVAGYQASQAASATITQNSALNSSTSNLVSAVSVSTTNAAVVDGTLEFSVIQTGTTIATQVFYITSNSPGGVLISTISNFNNSATTYTLAGVTVSLSGVATSDVGSTSYVKISQFVSSTNYTTTPALQVQTGANAGSAVSFNIGSITASALRVSNINVQSANSGFNALASEDTIGQVDNALNQILTLQSNIGAVQVRLQQESDNNNLASVNLQASESSIRDLNVAQASTSYTKEQLLISFGTSLLSQANSNSQSVLALFR